MANVITEINLNVQKQSIAPTIYVQQGDTARTLKIHLLDGISRFAISPNNLAVFSAKKRDGTSLYNTCNIINNTIYYEFTRETASCPGITEAEIKLYNDDEKLITTAPFFIDVRSLAFKNSDAVKSIDEQTVLDDLIQKAHKQESQIEDRLNSGAFNGASAYEIAVQNGYSGNEEQWLKSLQYNHSEEFAALSSQVKKDSTQAAISATSAEQASERSKNSADRADISAKTVQVQLETAQREAQSAKNEAQSAKSDADRAEKTLASRPTRAEVSCALTNTITSTLIKADDVSPLVHTLTCNIQRHNIFNLSSIIAASHLLTLNPNGVIFTSNGISSHTVSYTKIPNISGKFYFSAHALQKKAITNCNIIAVDYITGSKVLGNVVFSEVEKSIEFPINIGEGMGGIQIFIYSNNTGSELETELELTDPMLASGTEKKAYAPYVKDLTSVHISRKHFDSSCLEEYIPDVNGDIENMQSLAPDMIISSDTPGVLISVKYNQDINIVLSHIKDILSASEREFRK